MEATQERKGWSYYERPEVAPEIGITRRDRHILLELYINRFRNARQLGFLFGEAVHRRLKVLWKAGMIDRPYGTRFWRMRDGGGSQPGIYAITNRGVQVLIAFGDIVVSKNEMRDFDELNRTITGISSKIPHDLQVGDMQVSFACACRMRPSLDLAHALTLTQKNHVRSLALPNDDAFSLIPDWSFAITPEGREASLFFLELHRGTEPETRISSPDLSNLKAKYESYHAYARCKGQRIQFGASNFRVLTVITGGERMLMNVAENAKQVSGTSGHNRFLAAQYDDLVDGDPFEIDWLNAAGERVQLVV